MSERYLNRKYLKPYHRTGEDDGTTVQVLKIQDLKSTYCFRADYSTGFPVLYNDHFSDLRSKIPVPIKYKNHVRKATEFATKKRSTAERPVDTTQMHRNHVKRQKKLNAEYFNGGLPHDARLNLYMFPDWIKNETYYEDTINNSFHRRTVTCFG